MSYAKAFASTPPQRHPSTIDGLGVPGKATLAERLPPAPLAQVQAAGALHGANVHEVAAAGLTGAPSAVPHLDVVQRAFGHHDVGGVRAHVGGPAADAASVLGASAYASGDAVAFAQAPSLHLAAHELAHVVQQRGGVRLAGGVGRAGDPYEAHADAVADLVVRGESAEALLDQMAHRGSAGGAAVQYARVELTSARGAAARLRRVIEHANVEELAVIEGALEAAVAARGEAEEVVVRFAVAGDTYALTLTVTDAATAMYDAQFRVSMATRGEDACSTEGDTGGPGVSRMTRPGSAATSPAPIGGGGASFTSAIAGALTSVAGGLPGSEQELTLSVDAPLGAGFGIASGGLRLRIAHEAGHGAEPSGYLVAARLQLGAGLRIPLALRLRVMAGIEVSARGHDPAHAAQMVVLALDHAVREISAPLADAMFGAGAAEAAEAGMAEGDYADVTASITEDLRLGHLDSTSHTGGTATGSIGASSHWRTTGSSDGAPTERSYRQLDLANSFTIGFGAGVAELEVAVHLPSHARGIDDRLDLTFGFDVPAGATALGLAAVVGMLTEGIRTLRELLAAAGEPDRAAQVARAEAMAGVFGEYIRIVTLHDLAGRGVASTIGLEVQLHLAGTPSCDVRLVEAARVDVPEVGSLGYESSHLLGHPGRDGHEAEEAPTADGAEAGTGTAVTPARP